MMLPLFFCNTINRPSIETVKSKSSIIVGLVFEFIVVSQLKVPVLKSIEKN